MTLGEMQPKTQYVRSGDVHIAYQVVGQGPLDIVYIPGWLSHVELAWELPDLVLAFERLASDEGRFLVRHIPGARFVEVQGMDHSWWTQDRDAIIDEIEELLTGTKPAREADRVLATVLITDIVGATQAVVDHGDRPWLDLLSLDSIISSSGRNWPGFADAR